MTFLKKTTFLEQFYVHREIEQKLWRLPIYSLPPPATSPEDGTFGTTDEPMWAHYYHPECLVYIRVAPAGAEAMGLTYFHCYSIMRSISDTLKTLWAPLAPSSLPARNL